MWNRYVVTEHNRMVIRIVEPDEFIGRTVDERRPLAFQGDRQSSESSNSMLGLALAICLMLVVSFGGLIAFGLELALLGL